MSKQTVYYVSVSAIYAFSNKKSATAFQKEFEEAGFQTAIATDEDMSQVSSITSKKKGKGKKL